MPQFLDPTSTIHLHNTHTRCCLKPNLQITIFLTKMALRFTLSPPAVRPKPSLSCSGAHQIAASSSSVAARSVRLTGTTVQSRGRNGNGGFVVRSSLEAVTVTVGKVTEVDKDTFWPIVKAAGEKTVVLDMYTQWCGPCKVMAPKFQELSEKYLDVVFLKLDCNQDNKPLAKELGIRVVPTFKILKGGEVVKEVTGAKFDNLLLAIDNVRST